MPKLARLYLDTARLGLMSPSAQLAARDFARLAGEGVSTLYFQRFLREGFAALEPRLRRQLPGLASWTGMARLQDAVRGLTRLPSAASVFFASRTTALLQRSIQILWGRCRNVLIADTLWPPYRQILLEESQRQGARVTEVALRDEAFHFKLTAGEAIRKLASAYRRYACDGILLSAISHDGIRLPVRPLLRGLRSTSRIELAVIDGAQELAHAPVNLESTNADIYLASCHKWLGAHLPLGVCCLARPTTNAAISAELCDPEPNQSGQDALLDFLLWINDEALGPARSETVGLMPLICAAGALRDLAQSRQSLGEMFSQRRSNAVRVAHLAERAGWSVLTPSPPLRSAILLLESQDAALRGLSAKDLQARMDSAQVTLTAYEGGRIRLALPARPLTSSQVALLQLALRGERSLNRGDSFPKQAEVPVEWPDRDCYLAPAN